MNATLMSVQDVAMRIRSGAALLLAGDEALLRQLPTGSWIGGTIPYFMTANGGQVDEGRIFVDELPDGATCGGVRRYGTAEIDRIYADLPYDGFGLMIVPAGSRVHLDFAVRAPSFEHFAARPLVGWVSGVHLKKLGTVAPAVFDGATGEQLPGDAVVMHVRLPPGKVAEVGVVNIFREGTGPRLTFPDTGFSATTVDVDGVRQNLAEYIANAGIDTRLPLVADYCGTMVNVSIQTVDGDRHEVRFYAPVFAGLSYRFAAPVGDYVNEFTSHVPAQLANRLAFSCNCILNYLYSDLEGRKTGDIACPITFGEIGYQLLNQTMAYVTIESAG